MIAFLAKDSSLNSNIDGLGRAMLCPVMGARLGVDVVGRPDSDAELDVRLRLPQNVVALVNGPALGAPARRGRELEHVARLEVGEALSAALEHVGAQLTHERLGFIRGGEAGLGKEHLALGGVVDLELEAFAGGCDGGGVDAAEQLVAVFPEFRRAAILIPECQEGGGDDSVEKHLDLSFARMVAGKYRGGIAGMHLFKYSVLVP
ncbi:hypothetical protein B0T25DRAFT_177670 [Lasiosphaeria hispida]|uniref:Uncharacterized protein n=1 Tax=Lasiosphaeria hispida TaxID=260671 RepID=A0AAJ0MGV0_9PEZI|nr:hypothetical protein B0T25DRAFT_177670 [Lasiosphaeria hispida]